MVSAGIAKNNPLRDCRRFSSPKRRARGARLGWRRRGVAELQEILDGMWVGGRTDERVLA